MPETQPDPAAVRAILIKATADCKYTMKLMEDTADLWKHGFPIHVEWHSKTECTFSCAGVSVRKRVP